MKQLKNNFGKISTCVFQLKFNFKYYQTIKETLSLKKRCELLENIIKICINDFFE